MVAAKMSCSTAADSTVRAMLNPGSNDVPDLSGERAGSFETTQWSIVLDAAGEIIHSGGVSSSPGLYVMGLRFMRRRKSSFLDGVGADAAELAQQIHHRLTRPLAA